MEKILIGGGTGLLGSTVTPILRDHGYAVITVGRNSSADIRCDLSDSSLSNKLLSEIGPDILINMVALTDVDKCEIRRDEAFKTNVAAAENLADYARKRPAAYVVHISTDMVYDGPGPHTESPVCPMNVYALTKYAGELAYRGINGCILRTNFFGKSRCLGRRSFSDWILEMGLSGKDASLFTDVLFSPLKMETIAQLLCVIFEKKVVGTFNLASNCGMSKRDFAHHLLAQFSVTHHGFKDALSTEHQFTAPRPRDMRMTPFRLEQVIGITMPTLLDEIRSMTR